MITRGSIWQGVEGRLFQVIAEVNVEGHDWVYYRRLDNDDEPKEFSCYTESFLSRFHKLPEN